MKQIDRSTDLRLRYRLVPERSRILRLPNSQIEAKISSLSTARLKGISIASESGKLIQAPLGLLSSLPEGWVYGFERSWLFAFAANQVSGARQALPAVGHRRGADGDR